MLLNIFFIFVGFIIAFGIFGIFLALLYLKKLKIVSHDDAKESILRKINFKHILIFAAIIFFIGIVIICSTFYLKGGDNYLSGDFDYYVQIEEVGDIKKLSLVTFRGFTVGYVVDFKLADDSRSVIIKIKLDKENIKVYEGTSARLYGKQLIFLSDLELVPPEEDTDKLLKKGSTIPSFKKVSEKNKGKSLEELLSDRRLEKIIDNIATTTDNIKLFSHRIAAEDKSNKTNLKEILQNTNLITKNLKKTTQTIDNIISNSEVRQDLKASIKDTRETIKNTKETINKTAVLIDKTTGAVEKVDTSIQKFNDTNLFEDVDNTTKTLNNVLKDINEITSDEEVKMNIKDTTRQAPKQLKNVGCFTNELSKSLNKSFLLFRLMFGNPTGNVNKCFPENEDQTVSKNGLKNK